MSEAAKTDFETRCDLGMGCDEQGICYAWAHDQPERCPKKVPMTKTTIDLPFSPADLRVAAAFEAWWWHIHIVADHCGSPHDSAKAAWVWQEAAHTALSARLAEADAVIAYVNDDEVPWSEEMDDKTTPWLDEAKARHKASAARKRTGS